jgi:hypothetical protein
MKPSIAMHASSAPPRLCAKSPRRQFLSDLGMGFAGMAMGAMLAREGVLRAEDGTPQRAFPTAQPAHGITAPKAKSVIWIFLVGGMSQMESFDPKPELNVHAGKTIAESPYRATLDSPYLKKNLREFVEGLHKVPSQDLSAAGRLSEAWSVGHRDERLVPAPGHPRR